MTRKPSILSEAKDQIGADRAVLNLRHRRIRHGLILRFAQDELRAQGTLPAPPVDRRADRARSEGALSRLRARVLLVAGQSPSAVGDLHTGLHEVPPPAGRTDLYALPLCRH